MELNESRDAIKR